LGVTMIPLDAQLGKKPGGRRNGSGERNGV
jgi:hypothetical protein